MKEDKILISTLVNAQQNDSIDNVLGFCKKNYSSTNESITCIRAYSSGATTATPEEFDILI